MSCLILGQAAVLLMFQESFSVVGLKVSAVFSEN